MKNVRISVESSKESGETINLGNYESKKDSDRAQASIAFDIPDGADIKTEFENAWAFVNDQIEKKIAQIKSKAKETKGEGHGAEIRQRRRYRQTESGY